MRRIVSIIAFMAGIVSVNAAYCAPPKVKIPDLPLLAKGNAVSSYVATSNLQISSGQSFVYQAGFDPDGWTGSLKKLGVSLAGDGGIRIGTVPLWEAGAILTGVNSKGPDPTPVARKIYTKGVDAAHSHITVEFRWDSLSPTERTLLDASPLTGRPDGLGSRRTEYLRGARGHEQGQGSGTFRARKSVLGDIVNSTPVFAGAPAMHLQDADYADFHERHKARSGAVYVGANDGMLHAFDAESGRELFAYIPRDVIPELNWLTHPGYSHQSYVDGAIAVAEARVAGDWRTVLAAGMGAGAQGVFALDVTNPKDFAGGRGALWEFGDSDDPDMGNVLGSPVIGKFRTKLVDGKPEYKYFVVVGSGLNNYVDDGAGRFDRAAPGALFLLSLDKSPREKWKLNVNYYKFKTPLREPALANGLSAPALAVGDGGVVKYVYAGDLQGNLWRFDFTGNSPWTKARAGESPLFVATDGNGGRQPITTQPKIVFAPGGGYVVLFGTGKFIEESDAVAAHFKTQSFYGIYDTISSQYTVDGRSELEPRLLEREGDAIRFAGKPFAYGTAADARKGWYFDFLESKKTGERSVSNPVTSYGRIFFNSLIPCIAACAGASTRFYSLDALTGLPVAEDTAGVISRIGPFSTPMIFELGREQVAVKVAGKPGTTRKYTVVNFGTEGTEQSGNGESAAEVGPVAGASLPARRFGWREILNWQELRDAAVKK